MLKALFFDLDGARSWCPPVYRLTWVKILKPYEYDVTWDFYRDRISGRLTPESSLAFSPTSRPRR